MDTFVQIQAVISPATSDVLIFVALFVYAAISLVVYTNSKNKGTNKW